MLRQTFCFVVAGVGVTTATTTAPPAFKSLFPATTAGNWLTPV